MATVRYLVNDVDAAHVTAMHTLETARLTLEPQLAAHAQAMFVVLADPAIYAFENAAPSSLEWLHERYRKLESRCSADGAEQWLNWVLRARSGELIGCVQATVGNDGRAFIAYTLASARWGRGLASEAVVAMIDELASRYRVHLLVAVFKRANTRSRRLLERLGFVADPLGSAQAEDDEDSMQLLLDASAVRP